MSRYKNSYKSSYKSYSQVKSSGSSTKDRKAGKISSTSNYTIPDKLLFETPLSRAILTDVFNTKREISRHAMLESTSSAALPTSAAKAIHRHQSQPQESMEDSSL